MTCFLWWGHERELVERIEESPDIKIMVKGSNNKIDWHTPLVWVYVIRCKHCGDYKKRRL